MQNWSSSLGADSGPNRFPRARLRNIRWIRPEETQDPPDPHTLRPPSRFGFKFISNTPSTVILDFMERTALDAGLGRDSIYKDPDTIYAVVTDKAIDRLLGLSAGDHFPVFVITNTGDKAVLDFTFHNGDHHAALGIFDAAMQGLGFDTGYNNPLVNLEDRSLSNLGLTNSYHQPRLSFSDKGRMDGTTGVGSDSPEIRLTDKVAANTGLTGRENSPLILFSESVTQQNTTGDGSHFQTHFLAILADSASQAMAETGDEYFLNYIFVNIGDMALENVGVGLPGTVTSVILEKVVNRILTGSGVFDAVVLEAVSQWAARVVSNGGAEPAFNTKIALSKFYQGLIDYGLLTKVKVLNPFAFDNLIAAQTPLIVGPSDTLWANTNFVVGDLSSKGLKGNGSSKYLNSGLKLTDVWSSSDAGCSLYVSEDVSETAIELGAVDSSAQGLSRQWRLAAHQAAPNQGMLVSMFDENTNSGLTGRWTSASFATTVFASTQITGTDLKTYHASELEAFAGAGDSAEAQGDPPALADCLIFCSNEGSIVI